MTNLPEIMSPKDIGISIKLLDSLGNYTNLDGLQDFRIRVYSNTLKSVANWCKNAMEAEEGETQFEQLIKLSSTEYYGIIPAKTSQDVRGHKIIFQIVGTLSTGEIFSDEVKGFVYLKSEKKIDLIDLPDAAAEGLLMKDVIITFRTDRKVTAIAPSQPVSDVFYRTKVNITTAGYYVQFSNPIGTTWNDYILRPFFYNETGYKGFRIADRSKDGFWVYPDEDGTFECIVELRLSNTDTLCDIIDITTDGYEYEFANPEGKQYILEPFLYNDSGYKGFNIKNKTLTGFRIEPDEAGTFEFKLYFL